MNLRVNHEKKEEVQKKIIYELNEKVTKLKDVLKGSDEENPREPYQQVVNELKMINH